MSRAKALYILQDVRRLTRKRGVVNAGPIDRRPRWEVSHLAYLVAREQGLGAEFIAGIYQARWEQGRNISDPVVVGEVGAAIGLNAETLAKAADDPDRRAEGLVALRHIVRDGVFGVPFFVHGHEKFWGVDRLAEFAESVRGEASAGKDHTELVGHEGGGDQGHAGGCG
jgi:2-hydroxychromene-2-carboxylate isomerase